DRRGRAERDGGPQADQGLSLLVEPARSRKIGADTHDRVDEGLVAQGQSSKRPLRLAHRGSPPGDRGSSRYRGRLNATIPTACTHPPDRMKRTVRRVFRIGGVRSPRPCRWPRFATTRPTSGTARSPATSPCAVTRTFAGRSPGTTGAWPAWA